MQEETKQTVLSKIKRHIHKPRHPAIFFMVVFAMFGVLTLLYSAAQTALPATVIRQTNFDTDPGWEGVTNVTPQPCVTISQNFGYTPTDNIGDGTPGEIGGTIARSPRLAYYATAIPTTNLDSAFSTSGTFKMDSSNGVYFGWFNSGTFDGPPPDSLVLKLSSRPERPDHPAEPVGATAQVISHSQQVAGADKFLVLQRGQTYNWTMSYNPNGGQGFGQVTMNIEGHPDNIVFDLPQDVRQDGATFNRFGLFNSERTGASSVGYFSNLTLNGQSVPLHTAPPGWFGESNHATYQDCNSPGANNFGWKNGEVGGTVWRMEGPASTYADRLAEGSQGLSLSSPLEASGTFRLTQSAIDADVFIGWFNSLKNDPGGTCGEGGFLKDRLGFKVGAPTKYGIRITPSYSTSKGNAKYSFALPTPVVVHDGRVYNWNMKYTPNWDEKGGILTVTVNGLTMTQEVKTKLWDDETRFNRFGISSIACGGGSLGVHIDNLTYTAGLAALDAGQGGHPSDPGSTPSASTVPNVSNQSSNKKSSSSSRGSGRSSSSSSSAVQTAASDGQNGISGAVYRAAKLDPVQKVAVNVGAKPPAKHHEIMGLVLVLVLLASVAFYVYHDSYHIQHGGEGFKQHFTDEDGNTYHVG